MPKWKILIVLAVGLVMIAAMACGGAEEDPTPAPPPPAAVPPPPADGPPPPAAVPPPAAPPPAAAIGTGTKKGTYQAKKWAAGEFPIISLYDGPRPTTWQENPRFTKMVQDGTPFTVNSHEGPIPALDDRVPVETDRLVWDVVDEIGEYGGTWRMAHENNFLLGRRVLSRGEAVHFAGDYLTKVPIFLKDFSSSADGRVHTFTLREGAKFSNGEPLDMEAVKFAHEAINDNIELHPTVPAGWRDPVTGNGVQFAVVDDLTFTYTFDNPNFGAIEGGTPGGVSYCAGWCMFAPVEWTSKLVPGYADAAALQASIDDADVEDWLANLRTRLSVHSTQAADMPAVGPYLHSEGKTVGDKIGFVSNPYHVIFDPEGNQVPYVDGIVSLGFESRDIAVFRAMNGESDGTAVPYAVGELPLYQSNMEKGDYSLYQWTDFGGGDVGFMFNQTFNEDPEIGRLLRTKEFRIAFSHAIDREEINDNVLLGLGSPQNAIPHPSHPYYPGPEWATLDIEHDPALAMQMLDAIGLVDTDGDGIRNRIGDLTGDSGNFELFMEVPQSGHTSDRYLGIIQLIEEDLAEVGLTLAWKLAPSVTTKIRANELYILMENIGYAWGGNWAVANHWQRGAFAGFAPDIPQSPIGPLIGKWVNSEGAEGMAPTGPDPAYLPLAPEGNFPADPSGKIMELLNLQKEGKAFATLSPERIRIAHDIYKIAAAEKMTMNFVGFAGLQWGIMLKRNNFRNVPKHHPLQAAGLKNHMYYFEDGMDNMSNPGNKSKKYTSESFLTGLSY